MTTREEAIRQLQSLREHCRSMVRVEYEDGIWVQDTEAIDLALSALRPVSREQVDVVINSLKLRLENNEENGVVYLPKFAVEQMIERLEAIKNG